MKHRHTVASILLLAGSLLGAAACSRQQAGPEPLIIPAGTTSGGISAKPERALYSTRSTSLGAIVDPGATEASPNAAASPGNTVTIITAPVAASATPAVTQPQSTVNGGYGPLVGNVVASPSNPSTVGVITH